MAKVRALSVFALAIAIVTVPLTVGQPPAESVTVQTPAKPKAKVQVKQKAPSVAKSRKVNSPSTSRSYARSYMNRNYGWGKKQYKCLDKIWTKESGWNHKADNPNSSAFGIPQMLGMTTKDAKKQIHKGLKYIKHRYDTPCQAWDFWQKNRWY